MLLRHVASFITVSAALGGCFHARPSDGGGEVKIAAGSAGIGGVRVPAGYTIELITKGLTYPTGVAFDDDGRPHIVEGGYSYGESFLTPRLLRVQADGSVEEVARGDRHAWNGVSFADGAFYVAEGGIKTAGRVLRIDPKSGETRVLVDGLPSMGDHHVNGPVVRDGFVYFGVGTATNSAVVGPDNFDFGWLPRAPDFHDIPCRDITLAGENFTSKNPLTKDANDEATTGAYLPFGTPSTGGQVIKGALPCTGAVLRVSTNGGAAELVAWGFRNPFGLAFAENGKLFVTDNGYDQRGSRPVYGNGDWLWEIEKGAWYGWPDYADGNLIADSRYGTLGSKAPTRVLATDPSKPPQPRARFAVHSSSNGFDFSRSEAFGHVGDAFVAQFGDQAPIVGKVLAPVGFQVVRVDPQGIVRSFAANQGPQNGPASMLKIEGLERPIAVRFNPTGDALYIVDFGVLLMDETGSKPQPRTGALWRVAREKASRFEASAGGTR